MWEKIHRVQWNSLALEAKNPAGTLTGLGKYRLPVPCFLPEPGTMLNSQEHSQGPVLATPEASSQGCLWMACMDAVVHYLADPEALVSTDTPAMLAIRALQDQDFSL